MAQFENQNLQRFGLATNEFTTSTELAHHACHPHEAILQQSDNMRFSRLLVAHGGVRAGFRPRVVFFVIDCKQRHIRFRRQGSGELRPGEASTYRGNVIHSTERQLSGRYDEKTGHGETRPRHSCAYSTSTVHFFLASIYGGRLLPHSNHSLEQQKGLPQHRSTIVAVVIVLSWSFLSVASAAPFQFIFEGEGSGTLDSTPFSGPFTIELLANTNDVELAFADLSGRIHHVDGDATISLPVGDGVFLETVGLRSDEHTHGSFMPSVGFMARGDFLHAESEYFAGYRIDGPLGPVTTSVVWLADANPSAELDIGVLQFESVSEVTFTASLVPEPSTALLLGLGLIGFVFRLRQRT